MRRFLDRLIRLLALGCWCGGHYHLLWMVYPDYAEHPPGEDEPAAVTPPPPSIPRMRAGGR